MTRARPCVSRNDNARTGVDEILSPLSVEQFLESGFGKAPLHLKGAEGRFRELLDWNGLARVLETHDLDSRLKIVKAGKTISEHRYLQRTAGIARIDSGALSLLLAAGATLIINFIDDLVPPIGALADEIGDTFESKTWVNLYASRGVEHGFGPHWDNHDVIVLQLSGTKTWPLYRPTLIDPLDTEAFDRPPDDTVLECTEVLEDGHVLYVPRGWIHAPYPVTTPSMHLTIGITRPTGAAFLEWLAQDLREDPEIRASLPLPHDEIRSDRWKTRIAGILDQAIANGAVERFIVHEDARRGARPSFSFSESSAEELNDWDKSMLVRPASLHRLEVEFRKDAKLGNVLAAGRKWPCSRAVGQALGRLRSTRPLILGDLEMSLNGADAAQLRQMLALLRTFGVVALEQAKNDESELR